MLKSHKHHLVEVLHCVGCLEKHTTTSDHSGVKQDFFFYSEVIDVRGEDSVEMKVPKNQLLLLSLQNSYICTPIPEQNAWHGQPLQVFKRLQN